MIARRMRSLSGPKLLRVASSLLVVLGVSGCQRFLGRELAGHLSVSIRPVSGRGPHCSGVFVAHRSILTAAHCVANSKNFAIEIDGSRVESATLERIHDRLDLALLTASSSLRPEKVQVQLTTPTVGQPATLIGFGSRQGRDPGIRGDIELKVTQVREGTFLVRPVEAMGACLGDSGAPVWLMTPQPKLLGVLVAGSESCAGPDKVLTLKSVEN